MESRKEEFSSFDLLLFLWKWRKHIIIVCALAAVTSAVVSLLMEEKYRSTVVLYPAKTSSVSKSLLQESNVDKLDFMGFGEEEESEQILQILNSDEIRIEMIYLYDLWKHYGIDPNEPHANSKMRQEFESNVSFTRTKFGSVRIDVLDTSAITAASMANQISALLDSAKNRMQHERAKYGLNIVEEQYLNAKAELDALVDSLKSLGELGIHDYESQSEVLNQQYAIALGRGNKRGANAIQAELEKLGKFGNNALALTHRLEYMTENVNDLKARYMQAKVDAEAVLTHKFVVNNAYVSDKKAYPIRWLIVVLSTLSAFILTIFMILALDNISKLRAALNKA